MCATRGCLRARLNNLGKCVVTTAQHSPISFLCFPAPCPACLQSLPACLDNMARARLPGKKGNDTFQHHRWNFIFFGQTKTAIQDLLTTHIPISLLSYTESFAWVRQGKHCKTISNNRSVCVCVSAVARPCVPVSPSPAQHFCYSMMAWVTEAQIEPAFLLQLLLLFLLKL